MTQNELPRVKNEYELWRSAMDLLVNHYQQIAETLNEATPLVRIYPKLSECSNSKVPRITSTPIGKTYLVFPSRLCQRTKNGTISPLLWNAYYQRAKVSLHLSREESPFYFERLDNISKPNVPGLREIAYSPDTETFVTRRIDRCSEQKIEYIARNFFDDVVSKHFQN